MREAMPPAAEDLYESAFDAAFELTEKTRDAGIPPEKAAKVIRKALTSPRPKTRYLVGRDARGAVAAKRVLSDRAWDRMITRMAKVPKRDSALG
jgi:cation transport regulator ChaB